MISLIITLSMAIMGIMAAFFIRDRYYDDGVVGRGALLGMVGSSGLTLWIGLERVLDDTPIWDWVPAEFCVAVFMVSSTVFMARHMRNYWRWRCSDGAKHAWKK